jgi:hypothetical protein
MTLNEILDTLDQENHRALVGKVATAFVNLSELESIVESRIAGFPTKNAVINARAVKQERPDPDQQGRGVRFGACKMQKFEVSDCHILCIGRGGCA